MGHPPQLCRTSPRWVCKLWALPSVTGSRCCLCPRWRTPDTMTITTWSLLEPALTFWISSSLMSSALCVSLTQPWPRNSSITFWTLAVSSSHHGSSSSHFPWILQTLSTCLHYRQDCWISPTPGTQPTVYHLSSTCLSKSSTQHQSWDRERHKPCLVFRSKPLQSFVSPRRT